MSGRARLAAALLLHAGLLALAAWLLFAVPRRGYQFGDSLAYAHTARRLADEGDWLTLHQERLDREESAYFQKPPLAFWLAALGHRAAPDHPQAFVWPGELLALATLSLTAVWGNRLLGRPWGFAAGAGLLLLPVFVRTATELRMDPPLALGMLAACRLGAAPLAARWEPWRPTLFHVALALAVLGKGPQGLLPLAACPLGHLLGGARAGELWSRRGRWLRSAAPLALPALWWLQLAARFGATPFQVLGRDTLRGREAFPLGDFLDASALSLWRGAPLWLAAAGLGLALVAARLWRERGRGGETERREWGVVVAFSALWLVGWAAKPWQTPRYGFPWFPFLALLAVAPAAFAWRRGGLGWLAGPALVLALLWRVPELFEPHPTSFRRTAEDRAFLGELGRLCADAAPALVFRPELLRAREPLPYRKALHETYWFVHAYTGRRPVPVDPARPPAGGPTLWLGLVGAPVDALLAELPEGSLRPVASHDVLRVWRLEPASAER